MSHPTIGNLGAAPPGGFPQQQTQPGIPQPAPQPQPQPVPAPQPHPTVPFGETIPAPGAPVPAQAPGVPAGLNPNTVIQAGPGVPPELVGRTLSQAFGIYSALATEYVNRNPAPVRAASAQQTQQTQQDQAPAAAAPRPTPVPGQLSDEARRFYADPASYLEERDRKLVETIKAEFQNTPASQAAQQQTIRAAAEQAAAGVPDFQALMPLMGPIVEGVDASRLADPRMWVEIADLARGRAIRSGQYNNLVGQVPQPQPQAQPQPQTPNNGAWQAAGGNPQGAVPAQMQPVLPQFAFFTEAPTASGNTATGQPAGALTAEQKRLASQFGMSEETYAAWYWAQKNGQGRN